MTRGLSYSTLTKVLERLEANKRSRLVALSPSLQNFDRAIPLHLDHVAFDYLKIKVNDISFSFETHEVQLSAEDAKAGIAPGDIVIDQDYSNVVSFYNFVNYYLKDKRVGERRLPGGLDLQMAMRMLACHLFDKREEIKVHELGVIISEWPFLRLPVGAKFKISQFDIAKNDLKALEPLIHPSSLPLKVLKLGRWRDGYNENVVIEAAETLILDASHFGRDVVSRVMNTRHRCIEVEGACFSEQSSVRVVRSIKENGRELGFTLTVWISDEEYLDQLFDELKKEFHGKWVTSQEVGETLPTCDILCISLNETSEILIYGIKRGRLCLRMQVVPIGNSIPIPDKNLFNYFKFIVLLCIIIFYGHGMLADLIVSMFSLIIPI